MEVTQQTLAPDIDFTLFQRKVKAAYGLDLSAYKRPQMERRIRANMDRCGARTFWQYYALLQKDEAVLDEFLDRVTINVSELFRDPEQFEVLRRDVLPKLRNDKNKLSVWSAGCSYGAEPYTLAILLNELSPGLRHCVHATDIDDRMLARARQGIFSEQEVRNVSKMRLAKYFSRCSDGYEAKRVLKEMIDFRKHNLLEDRFRRSFDLIACRNVVIYFTEDAKSELYDRFYGSLRPGGYLFVGGTERVADYAEIGFENKFPFLYRKAHRN